MTTLGPWPAATTDSEDTVDWVSALSFAGAERDRALRDLHALLIHAARHQVHRMGHTWGGHGAGDVDELVNQAADEALVALLGKLHTFEGRSRFTTWAYKFAVLHAANAVRAAAWRGREIQLDGLDAVADPAPEPNEYAEGRDLVTAVRRLLRTALTPHQRRVVVALLIDDVPIDVLAERLGTNRNALYKTLHDARVRIRAALVAEGLIDVAGGRSVMSPRPLGPREIERLTLDTLPWLSCDDCFGLVDEYVEELLAGELTARPAMRAHLRGCPACAEEAATLAILAAEDAGQDPAAALAVIGL